MMFSDYFLGMVINYFIDKLRLIIVNYYWALVTVDFFSFETFLKVSIHYMLKEFT